MNETKICKECYIEKNIDEFGVSGKNRRINCKTCVNENENLYKKDFMRRLKYYEKFKELVELKSGTVLSLPEEYINQVTKLRVKCKYEHIFHISLDSLKKSWCNQCNINIPEFICIKSIEYLFGELFEKARPRWLINNQGNNLELDGYNKKLQLAVEYNGMQHYKHIEYFYKTKEAFEKRIEHDLIKQKLCKENNVNLIIVDYTVKIKDMCLFIYNKCIELNYNIKNKPDLFNLTECYKLMTPVKSKIETIIKEKNGKIIHCDYIKGDYKLIVSCHLDHKWNISYKALQNNTWCPICKDILEKSKVITFKRKNNETRSKNMAIIRENFRKELIEKKCNYCGIILPLTSFNKKSNTKSGYQTNCKQCVVEIKRKWRQKRKIAQN